jgi:hypothetical protein
MRFNTAYTILSILLIAADEAALKDLNRAAVAFNLKGKSKPKRQRAGSKRAD